MRMQLILKLVEDGPIYPDLGSAVAKHRRRGPVAEMPKAMRYAYGEAVERAVRAKQRSELQAFCTRAVAPSRQEPVGKARLAMLNGRLLAYPALARRRREHHEWQSLYEKAMAEKAARL